VSPLGLEAFAPLRTNLTVLGIPVPPGSYRFDLVYAPDSVRLGLWISGASLLLLAALAGGRLVWRRRMYGSRSA
jgi:hypothetical protein